ncbi:hypothetical protein GGI26_006304 [Coemansia sp. RSA 1358]|uniref:CNH domain-containing protein n=1 Tax=Coemansia umbellata TaxID=1424467 RepID=A0ABQ8PD21_9FUNG|nr:hypothetical protein BX070DRAFT_230761 [Coemansia spiralis]KAI9501133.1 hypothetical protein BX070DRAFT_229465 [Coemansia spiralis]KAJ1986341.1 hypothetical protein EDC05_006328 [Coemansia umbellata]KAJ2618840.1 hypothetical protein GGI26_006304 [Coemansia sp. RSA 1358]
MSSTNDGRAPAEPYIMQPLAIDLQLEDSTSSTWGIRARRQSLSQRLGLQSLGIGKEPKEKSPEPSTASQTNTSPQSTPSLSEHESSSKVEEDKQQLSSSLPTGHSIARIEDAQMESQLHSQPPAQSSTSHSSAKQKSVKIECVEITGENMFVGTSDGHVVHYTVATPEIELEQIPEHFKVHSVDLKLGGKRVEQMIAFPTLCRLVVLCGSTVVFYSLPELRPVPANSMPAIKGVSCIAYDERIQRSTATTAILCVARMRGVYIYRLSTDLKLEQEVAMESSVASICQYGNYVCLADTETYKILDLAKLRTLSAPEDGQLILMPTQQPRKDPVTGKIVRPPRPRTLVVGPNEFMFLTSSGDEDTLGVIVTAMGEALRGTLQFSSYPKSVAYDDPYVIVVFGSGQVEVFDTRMPEQTLVQSFFDNSAGGETDVEARRARRLCMVSGFHVSTNISRPEVIEVQGLDGTNASTGSPLVDIGDLFGTGLSPKHKTETSEHDTSPWTSALSQSHHWMREALGDNNPNDADSRAGKVLSRFVNANLVIVSQDSLHFLADKPQLVRVDQLIREQRIEEAVLIVEKALASDPTLSSASDEVSYCFQMAGMVYFKNMLFDDSLHYFCRGNLDPRALLHLFPEYSRYLGTLLIPFGRIPMAAGLRRIFYEISDVQKLIQTGAEQLSGDDNEQVEALRETLKSNVLEVAERYLEHCKAQMKHRDQPFAPDSMPVIDTALARLYAENKHDEKQRSLLLSRDNSIVSDLACQFFMESENYYYCSLLYKMQGEVYKVLDIWRRILLGKLHDPRSGGLAEYLQYIQKTNDQELLLNEYYWLVDFDVGVSLEVLKYDLSDTSVASIDADKIIQKMEKYGDQPLGAFIERLLTAKHKRATHYMTYLIKVYVRQLRDYYMADGDEKACERRNAVENGYKYAQAENLNLTFRSYLKPVRNMDWGTNLRAQLLETLSTRLPSYDPSSVLECIETEAKDLLLTERAMLLVILNRISEAADLLVNQCGDYAEAELLLLKPEALVSLAQLNQSQLDATSSVLHQDSIENADDMHQMMGTTKDNVCKLLHMYLELSKNDDEMAARLVSAMLAKYFNYVDIEVLNDIPDHWPYSIVEPFVIRCLQKTKRLERGSTTVRSLHESLALASKVDMLEAAKEGGTVTLDFSQTCAKCKKLLGSSAFVYELSTQQVKHISCT